MPPWGLRLASDRGLLGLVLAIALLHGLFEARSRPLYQVPDEMAYLRAAQGVALAHASDSARSCIAPPDGALLDSGDGGKAGFRLVTGLQLRWLCRGADEALPLFALRAWQALSLPLVAWAAWYLALLLSGRQDAGIFAALLVAVHPVAAVFAGGVTPDAWANAFAAGAFVGATRLALARDRWWDPWLLGACLVGGLLWKDTTNAVLALVPAVMVVRLAGRASRPVRVWPPRAWLMLASLVVFTALVVGLATALLSPYVLQAETTRALLNSPGDTVGRVLGDTAFHAQGLLASSLLSLYRPLTYLYPDPHQPLTPPYVTLVFIAFGTAALLGAVRSAVRSDEAARRQRRIYALWLPVAVLCVVQPSIRQVLVGVEDLHQGRWLFPLLAPAAALVGAGVVSLFSRRRVLPLWTTATLSSLWVVVFDVVRHYYARYPDTLLPHVLFTRPTGDHDIGDASVLRLIVQTTDAQTPLWTWGILVLLVVATIGLAVSVVRHAPSPTSHV